MLHRAIDRECAAGIAQTQTHTMALHFRTGHQNAVDFLFVLIVTSKGPHAHAGEFTGVMDAAVVAGVQGKVS